MSLKRFFRLDFLTAILGVMSLSIVLVLIYWPGLSGGFFFDDVPSIVENPAINLFDGSFSALLDVVASGSAGLFGRPISMVSFALDQFFFGADPFYFKLTNLAIHAANGLLVFVVVRRLLCSFEPQCTTRASFAVAILVAAAWLLHPIQLLPVLHVVQRMTCLSAFFLLLAFLFHMRGRESSGVPGAFWFFAGWCICWPLSIFSKETGLLFPAFVLVWEMTARRLAMGGKWDWFARGFCILVCLAMVGAAAYLLSPKGNWIWAGYEFRSFSMFERVLTEGRVLWFYLSLIVFPRLSAFGLFHDDFVVSTGLGTPWTTALAFAGLAGLFAAAWMARKRAPLVTFGIAWFIVGHSLESTVLPLELVHEHRNYLPLLGILLALASGVVSLIKAGKELQTLGMAVSIGVCLYYPFSTALRAQQYGDDFRRTQLEVQYHPDSALAQYEAGRVLAGTSGASDRGNPGYFFAKADFERAGQLDSNFKLSWLGLIYLNCKAHLPPENYWVEELARRLAHTPFGPADRNVLLSIKELSINGNLCLDRRQVDSLFVAAIANPKIGGDVQAILYSWYADYLWLGEKDWGAASRALDKSLALVPWNTSNRLKKAQLQFVAGEFEQVKLELAALRVERLSREDRKILDQLAENLGILKP